MSESTQVNDDDLEGDENLDVDVEIARKLRTTLILVILVMHIILPLIPFNNVRPC